MVHQNLLILGLFILLYGIFSRRIEKTVFSGPVLVVIVGLFTGAVVMSIGYKLYIGWINSPNQAETN